MNPLARLQAKAQAKYVESPSGSISDGDEVASFLLTGEDATASIVAQSYKKVSDLYEHEKPSDLKFNPNVDATGLTPHQVMQAYQYYVGMHAYAIVELAKLDAEVAALDFNMKIIQRKLTIAQSSEKRKKYALDAEIGMNTEHMRLSKSKAEKVILRTMMEATAKGLEAKAAFMSRELSRRQMDAELTRSRV